MDSLPSENEIPHDGDNSCLIIKKKASAPRISFYRGVNELSADFQTPLLIITPKAPHTVKTSAEHRTRRISFLAFTSQAGHANNII